MNDNDRIKTLIRRVDAYESQLVADKVKKDLDKIRENRRKLELYGYKDSPSVSKKS